MSLARVDHDKAVLRERIAELEWEVEMLRGQAVDPQTVTLRQALGLERGAALVLARLLKGPIDQPVSAEALCLAMPARNGRSHDRDEIGLLKVYICMIRRAIGKDGVLCVWGFGYQLSEAGRDRVVLAMALHRPGWRAPLVRERGQAMEGARA